MGNGVGAGIAVAVGGGAAVVGMAATVAVDSALEAGSVAQARVKRSRHVAIHSREIATWFDRLTMSGAFRNDSGFMTGLAQLGSNVGDALLEGA